MRGTYLQKAIMAETTATYAERYARYITLTTLQQPDQCGIEIDREYPRLTAQRWVDSLTFLRAILD